MTIMFFLFLGAMLGLQKAAGYEHGKKTSVMIICHLKYGQIWRAKVQEQTVREAFFKNCAIHGRKYTHCRIYTILHLGCKLCIFDILSCLKI